MTPHQQVTLYAPNEVAETLTFNSHEEYLQWAASR